MAGNRVIYATVKEKMGRTADPAAQTNAATA
jgi:hypothetical protein